MAKKLIVVAGPTASGKTALAIELAKHYQTEIISCDSRQVFREIEIGTAKPSEEELAQAKHHFINSHSIEDRFSAGDFEREGLKLLSALFQKYDNVIMVGGSGLYVRSLCHGLDSFQDIDASFREQLNVELETKGIEALQEELKVKDPLYYQEIDTSNSQRLIRALEICRGTGKPVSFFRTSTTNKRAFDIVKIGVELPRDVLYARVNHRVDLMVEAGLIEEAKALENRKHLNALQTVGYAELFAYFDGKYTKEEALELIKRNTRRYAKRQITWFNKEKGLVWMDVSKVQKVIDFIEANGL